MIVRSMRALIGQRDNTINFLNRRRVPERELFKSVATEQNKTRSLDCLETYINLKMIPKWSSLSTLSARSIAFESAITKS